MIPAWLIAVLLLVSLAGGFFARRLPAGLGGAICVAALTTALVLSALPYAQLTDHAILLFAYCGGGLAILWSLVTFVADAMHRRSGAGAAMVARRDYSEKLVDHGRGAGVESPFGAVSFVAWMVCAVGTGVLIALALVMRVVTAGMEISRGAPLPEGEILALDFGGLLIIFAVMFSCMVMYAVRRQRGLLTLLFWLAVTACWWYALSMPLLRGNGFGGYERTGVAALLALTLGVTVVVFSIARSRDRHRTRKRWVMASPDLLTGPAPDWPGLSMSVGIVGLMVVVLVIYGMAAPVALPWGGYRMAAVVRAAATLLVGGSALACSHYGWSRSLADLGLGAFGLGLANVALVFAPTNSAELAARFPAMFNAMLIGIALAVLIYGWMSIVWRQQLDDGVAWTTAGRLIPATRQVAFFLGVIALLIGLLMAIWPTLVDIATMDDSFGRVISGVAGYLLMMVVFLWCARRLRPSRFGWLTAMSVMAMLAFLVVRIRPFSGPWP